MERATGENNVTERQETDKEIRKFQKTVRLIANLVLVVLGVGFLVFAYWYSIAESMGKAPIHFLNWGLKNEYVDRVEDLDGYKVVMYTEDFGGYTLDGHECMTMYTLDEDIDYDWRHEEISSVHFYRKYFLFSKETEAENFIICMDDDENLKLDVFTFRGKSGKYHYFLKRHMTLLGPSEGGGISFQMVAGENVDLRYNGEPVEIIDHIRFDSDIDYSNCEGTFYIGDKACHIEK